MKPIPTPFTGAQLSKLLDTMTPEQLERPVYIYLTPQISGNLRVLSILSHDSLVAIHTDGIISETLQTINQELPLEIVTSLIDNYNNIERN